MANYYTKFSVVVPASQEAADYVLKLYQTVADMVMDQEDPDEIVVPPELRSVIPIDLQAESVFAAWNELQVTQVSDGLWFRDDAGSGGLTAAIALIQHLLVTFDKKRVVGFSWAHDCSSPRTDGYGGGACVVAASGIITMDTSRWLAEKLDGISCLGNHGP